ncbi:MAG: hypothetical protein ACK5M3_00420 [Dysgonomonas sp.]
MKNLNLKWLTILSVISILFVITSCESDDNDQSSNKKIPYSIPCLEWKAPKDKVLIYMDGFTLTGEETNYFYYTGKKVENIISYQFQDGSLDVVALTIPSTSVSLSDLKSTLNKYIYLGEIDGVLVYANEAENTLATISTFVKNNILYYAVGWSPLNP